MKRKDKEAAIRAYLKGDTKPIRRFKSLLDTKKPGLKIIADREPEIGFSNLNVYQGDNIIESHERLSQAEYEALVKRLGKHYNLFIIY
ncbi:hypothetical protein BWI93_04520 [Siphonobacter sp. BAB-5385]|uniref:hypothetical protein n=1 Tax=Siphonobacter sp. BAB-5385 TaxID=1864822 RepID=UPI000B9E31E6|nr:hypothetical protein [Siphonobacter sp. BAB-5385]OZI09328.1 hypothetical protein BWI93_04520 [Siphonobacter sp. BAB-5385]